MGVNEWRQSGNWFGHAENMKEQRAVGHSHAIYSHGHVIDLLVRVVDSFVH